MRGESRHGGSRRDARALWITAASLVIGISTLSIVILPADVAGAASDTVTTCSGSGTGSLPAVVASAAAGDTITFVVSCPPTSPIVLSSTIEITQNLTIDGPGAGVLAVSGNDAVGVFTISSAVTAAISGLTIEDGSASNGGGIANTGTVDITDSTLSSNNAGNDEGGGDGGAIYNDAGTVTVTGSTLSDNIAGDGGGAVDNDAGTVTITNSNLSNNTAADGGGVDNGDDGGTGTVDVTDSTLSYNDAGDGGGVDNGDNGGTGTVDVTNSTVSYNSPGGICNCGEGTVAVTESIVSDNTTGDPGGGGIFNAQGGTLTVTDSTLSDNQATNGFQGGAIEDYGTLDVGNSTVSHNDTAQVGNGGGIDIEGGTATVSDSFLSSNVGGAITNHGGTLTVSDSTLSDDSAGGGIENVGGTLSVVDTTLWANSEGGGIANTGGSATITASTIVGNNTFGAGAGGITTTGGSVGLAATIVAASGEQGNCSGTIVDLGYNLASDSSCGLSTANRSLSDARPELGPLQDNGGPTVTMALEPGSPAIGAVDSASLCSIPDQRGVARPTPCDIGAVQLTLPPETITSPSSATATVGQLFSFTVTTSGTSVPILTEDGTLPKHIRFVDNGNGSATFSGTPDEVGVYDLTITAAFGRNATRYVATQVFALNVVSRPAFTSADKARIGIGAFTFSVVTTGTPTAALSGSGLPPWLTLTDDHNGTATLNAAETYKGRYRFTLTASNVVGSVNQMFTLVVA